MRQNLTVVCIAIIIFSLTIGACGFLKGSTRLASQSASATFEAEKPAMRQAELKRVATLLGVAEDWLAVKSKVYCGLLAHGRLIDEAQKALLQLDTWMRYDEWEIKRDSNWIDYKFASWVLSAELGDPLIVNFDGVRRITQVSVKTPVFTPVGDSALATRWVKCLSRNSFELFDSPPT